jgi:hypothetical protein
MWEKASPAKKTHLLKPRPPCLLCPHRRQTRLLITVSVFLFCFWKIQYFSGFLGFLQDSFVLHSNTGDNSYVAFYIIPYRYRAKAQGVLDTITQEQEWVITVPDQPKTVFYSNPEDYCSN